MKHKVIKKEECYACENCKEAHGDGDEFIGKDCPSPMPIHPLVTKELENTKWNLDPVLGEFLSRKGVENLLTTVREETIRDFKNLLKKVEKDLNLDEINNGYKVIRLLQDRLSKE